MIEVRTCSSLEFCSTMLPGSMLILRGLPKVSTAYAELVPETSMRLVFRLAVGVNLQFHRHAEQVHVLLDFAHNAEAFLRAVDGVLVLEFGRAGGVEPLGEEPRELLAGSLLCHLAEIVNRGGFAGVLRQEGAHGLVEGLVADDPAQHVQDHAALVGHQRLELRRKRCRACQRRPAAPRRKPARPPTCPW